MNCLNCNSTTANPKFCTRSCAARFNNQRFPKRKLEGICKICLCPISRGRTFCKGCYNLTRSAKYQSSTTLGELRGEGNANFGGRYSYIRSHSRKTFIAAGRNLICSICQYSTHVDICHIKDVSLFSEEATLAQINSLSNLISLCKNHHWEFDHNIL